MGYTVDSKTGGPTDDQATEQTTKPSKIRVQDGESLAQLATRLNVSITDILDNNPGCVADDGMTLVARNVTLP